MLLVVPQSDNMKYLLVFAVFVVLNSQHSLARFINEKPVKLLDIHSLATRYPASDSEFRLSLENGQDEEVDLTAGEVLNGFPTLKLTLNPGGCAFYQFSVESDQVNIFIQPAKKKEDGDIYWSYCNKAPIEVIVEGFNNVTFDCFIPNNQTDPCSSEVCHYDITSALSPDEGSDEVSVEICADIEQENTGAIWEINFSRSNDSNKLEAYFIEDARENLLELKDDPDTNTQLSFVSIVGVRGVGKSTVASLLSGNSSMFEVGSGSVGTTTTGADVSPVIPAKEWAGFMQNNLDTPVHFPEDNLPMFLIDSEGMGVRSDEFDFMATSPPAIISKVVIWIGAEVLQTNEVLLKIKDYLRGLDLIINARNEDSKGQVFCDIPSYGHFIIVINKMIGSSTDIELTRELLEPEPDDIEGSEERNRIRSQIVQCFEGVEVHGLPFVNVPEGEHLDYHHLDDRFKSGLVAITNSIVERLSVTKFITVTDTDMELNATNAEFIIETVIKEANEGVIDLNGFGAFWSMVQKDIKLGLKEKSKEIGVIVNEICTGNQTTGFSCSSCVCQYIDELIKIALNEVQVALNLAVNQAQNTYQQDLKPYIDEFMETVVNPWQIENSCSGTKIPPNLDPTETCDLTVMNLQTPGQPLELSCQKTFICGTVTIDALSVSITTEDIFLDNAATIQNVVPPKAANGNDGVAPGENGSDGASGAKGFDISLTANSLLPGSSSSLTFMSQGGDGGNGGAGQTGSLSTNPKPANIYFTTPYEVQLHGPQVDYTQNCYPVQDNKCTDCDTRWYHALDVYVDACGGIGGDGGDGGEAGAPGKIQMLGNSGIQANYVPIPGQPGAGGLLGRGGWGRIYKEHYTGYKRIQDKNIFWVTGCTNMQQTLYEGYGYTPSEEDCTGKDGLPGKNGREACF